MMMDTFLIKLWLRNFVEFIGIIFDRIQNILDIKNYKIIFFTSIGFN